MTEIGMTNSMDSTYRMIELLCSKCGNRAVYENIRGEDLIKKGFHMCSKCSSVMNVAYPFWMYIAEKPLPTSLEVMKTMEFIVEDK